MPTFAAWESTVLQDTYDLVDYISLHAYYEEHDGDLDSFLASAVDMERFIDIVVATCDHVRARLKSKKQINLSFDEWNVWYLTRPEPQPAEDWQQAPRLLEDVYSVTDAVVFGSLLIALLRHADRVTVACLAQLVNVIAPIMTEPGGPAWRQTTFYPFAQAQRTGAARSSTSGGLRRRTRPRSTASVTCCTPPPYATTNRRRSPSSPSTATATDALPLEVVLNGLEFDVVVEHRAYRRRRPGRPNTLDDPERVTPHQATGTTLQDGRLTAVLEPLSWNVIRLA